MTRKPIGLQPVWVNGGHKVVYFGSAFEQLDADTWSRSEIGPVPEGWLEGIWRIP